MSGLERESLAVRLTSEVVDLWRVESQPNPDPTVLDRARYLGDALAESVDQIANARVKAALEAVAVQIEMHASECREAWIEDTAVSLDTAARIVRAAADTT